MVEELDRSYEGTTNWAWKEESRTDRFYMSGKLVASVPTVIHLGSITTVLYNHLRDSWELYTVQVYKFWILRTETPVRTFLILRIQSFVAGSWFWEII